MRSFHIAALCSAILGFASAAHATTILVPGTGSAPAQTGVTTLPATVGTQGYTFFDFNGGGNLVSACSYATLTGNGSNTPGVNNSYAFLTVGGSGSRETGVEYNTSGVNGTTLETITLSGGTAGTLVPDFQLGVMTDNASQGANNMLTVELSLAHGTSGTSDSVGLTGQSVAGNATVHNDFYFFTVSGAHIGDTIAVSGTVSSTNLNIGGITFDPSPTPEPGSLSLLALGAVGLLRRRSRAV